MILQTSRQTLAETLSELGVVAYAQPTLSRSSVAAVANRRDNPILRSQLDSMFASGALKVVESITGRKVERLFDHTGDDVINASFAFGETIIGDEVIPPCVTVYYRDGVKPVWGKNTVVFTARFGLCDA